MTRPRTFLAPYAALLLTLLFAGTATARSSAAPDTQSVILLATSDVHGHLTGSDDPGGYRAPHGLARLSTLLRRARSLNPNILYLDAGDLMQGTPMSELAARQGGSAPQPLWAALDSMGCAAMALGNHDFDFGKPLLERMKRAGDSPWCVPLAANVLGPDGQPVFAPYKMVQVGAVRIGILGLTTAVTPLWEPAANVAGYTFEDPVTSAARWVGVLRSKERADLVVCLLHGGFERDPQTGAPTRGQLAEENRGFALANAGLGLDAIVLGHTHQRIWGMRVGGSLVVQPGKWADRFSRIEFRMYRSPAGVWKVLAARPGVLSPSDTTPEDPVIAKIARPYEDAARTWSAEKVAVASTDLTAEAPGLLPDVFTSMVNDAQLEATHADVSVATLYTPSLRIPAGTITQSDLYRWYGYQNNVVTVRCTARTLKAALEQSATTFVGYNYHSADSGLVRPGFSLGNIDVAGGVTYRVNLERPDGSRVTGIQLRGRMLQPEDSVTVALSSYRASGAGGYPMWDGLPVIARSTATIRELLEARLRALGTVGNKATGTWSVIPAYITDPERETFDLLVRGGDALVTPDGKLLLKGAPSARATSRESLLATARRRFTELVLLETTDFHGSLLGGSKDRVSGKPLGSAAALSGYIRRERRRFPNETLLLDGGDAFQGTAISNLAFGRPVLAMMKALGTDVMTVGNHEFDWSVDTLVARIRDASFPVISANIREKASGERVRWVKPYVILHKNGLNVGVIGLTTQTTPSTTFPTNVEKLEFPDPIKAANELVGEVRAKGADVVVVLDHEGGEVDRDGKASGTILNIARGLSGVDVVFGGHTHNFICTKVGRVPVVVSASHGRALGEVRVLYDRTTRSVVSANPYLFTVYTDSVAPDTAMASLVERLGKDVKPLMARVLGTADVELSRGGDEPRMGNFVADVLRRSGSAQIGFQNSGGVRSDIPAGPITMGQVYELMPFENTVVNFRMTGAELKSLLEEWFSKGRGPVASGITITVNRGLPEGQRVLSLVLEDGTAVDPAKTYVVATNDFLAAGGDGLTSFKKLKTFTNTGILMREAIAHYIEAETKAGRAIHPAAGSRVIEVR